MTPADSSDRRNTATLMADDRGSQRMAVRARSATGVTLPVDRFWIVAASESAAVEDLEPP